MPPSVPVARLGPIDARARTRLPNEIDMTIVDSGRESRVAAAARTAGIASASSSPGRAPEPAPRGFAAHTIGEEHFYGHMLSGALAGTTEHCAMFPLDTIKTRMQTATTSAVAGATLGGSTVPSQSWIPRSGTTILSTINPVASIRAAASGVVRSHGVAGELCWPVWALWPVEVGKGSGEGDRLGWPRPRVCRCWRDGERVCGRRRLLLWVHERRARGRDGG